MQTLASSLTGVLAVLDHNPTGAQGLSTLPKDPHPSQRLWRSMWQCSPPSALLKGLAVTPGGDFLHLHDSWQCSCACCHAGISVDNFYLWPRCSVGPWDRCSRTGMWAATAFLTHRQCTAVQQQDLQTLQQISQTMSLDLMTCGLWSKSSKICMQLDKVRQES